MPTPSLDVLLSRIEAIAPAIRAEADRSERGAGLTRPVVAALREAGLFQLWIPASLGGFELSLPEALTVYEAVARIDGSAGWAVMIGSGGGLFGALLEPAAAEEIFRREDALVAGSGAPDGHAERVDGGYRVRGRWRYASGAAWATTFTANCVVTPGDAGHVRAMAFDASQVRIVETWDTTGMRATGSHDIEVADAFVPEARSFAVGDASRETGPLYRLPFTVVTELPVTAVALGIAAHAIEAFARQERAGDPLAAAQFARSDARLRSARAHVRELAEAAWQEASAARTPSPALQARITAGCVHAVADLLAVTRELAGLAGMSALRTTDELGRATRDLQALSAHASVATRQLVAAGRSLLNHTVD